MGEDYRFQQSQYKNGDQRMIWMQGEGNKFISKCFLCSLDHFGKKIKNNNNV